MGREEAKRRLIMRMPDLPREMTEENYGKLVDTLSTAFRELTVDNWASQVIKGVVIPASAEIKISHNLKSVPLYRIILRQNDANALITDGSEAWTDKYITLKNQTGNDTIVTVMIMRG